MTCGIFMYFYNPALPSGIDTKYVCWAPNMSWATYMADAMNKFFRLTPYESDRWFEAWCWKQ